jgi:hypothetical protein
MYNSVLQHPEIWGSFEKGDRLTTVTAPDLSSLKGKVLVVIGCSKSKIGYDHTVKRQAREMYTGSLFKAAREYANAKGFDYGIISAKYGYLHPDTVIEGYDKFLRTRADIETIRPQVNEALKSIRNHYDRVLVVGGKNYRQVLSEVTDPGFLYLKGKGYADMCQQLRNATRSTITSKIETYA